MDPDDISRFTLVRENQSLRGTQHLGSGVEAYLRELLDGSHSSRLINRRTQGLENISTEFVSAVIGAMESHGDLSTQILNNSEISHKLLGELVPLIYKELKATA